ncbi:transposase [Candidatus Neptunichlamydia sp. REUL1]|uniref:transposase n=1 Tax=Candidatus Neptunichlamydia sp. REUL1 TaxID=3064277 RepID=UPI00293071F9|nr:transposase [Candidatus Neptunochlamydia sp. REUL1]
MKIRKAEEKVFQGLSEKYFKLLEPLMEEWTSRNCRGRKLHPWRPVINSIFWVLSTGAPWWALPKGKNFAHRSTAHSCLGKMESEGFLEEVLVKLIEVAELIGGVEPDRLTVLKNKVIPLIPYRKG